VAAEEEVVEAGEEEVVEAGEEAVEGNAEGNETGEVVEEVAEEAAAPQQEEAPVEEAPAEQAPEEPKPEEPQGFNLDWWKRLYSNTDDTATIVPEFWKRFDKEGWSLWFANYKYSSDYTKKLQASNLIGGWFQRLDGARRVAFGNVHVFGAEPNLELAGFFLVQGKEVPPEFTEVADHEQWDFTKVDPDDEAQRRAVGDFMCWAGDFGRPAGERRLLVGKTFK